MAHSHSNSRSFGTLDVESPSPSPPLSPQLARSRPSWQRTRSSASHLSSNARTWQSKLLSRANALAAYGLKLWRGMALWQKVAFVLFMITMNVLVVLFLVYNEALMVWLQPRAVAWSERPGGWLLIWFLVFITAFPPLIGYSTTLTMCGFIYGVWPGWPIAASANVAGATASFVVCRYFLRSWIRKKVENDKRFQALALVLKHDGLKLLTMIRLCPLPYSISNGALSTFPTLGVPMFIAATAFATPKLFVHVFVGSRFAAIGKHGEDSTAKLVNYVGIGAGTLLGAVTGWVIWQRTQARSKQLEAEEQAKLMEGGRAGREDEDEDALRDENELAHPDAFADGTDDLDGDMAAAQNDDIDFLGTPAAHQPYTDHSDDEATRKPESDGR